jgi:hypothetical protein
MWTRLCLTLCALFISAACQPISPAAPPASEETYLRAVMAPELFTYANIDAPSLENLAVMPTGGLEVRLFPGQPLVHNGVRAQISVDYPFQPGETVRYDWQMRFPADFQPDPQNRWWIIAEWHDQPDTRQGEIWESFPVRSAIIMFTYAFLDGQPTLGVHYGPGQPLIGTIPIRLGEWMRLRAVIGWSQGADGWMEVYQEDETTPLYRASGPNMYNAYPHYFLVGLYRHREIAVPSSLQVRGIAIERLGES